MKTTILSAVILCAASTQVLAEGSAYWFGSDGEYARSRNGHCVRTILWTPEKSIDGCEGRAEKPAPVAKAAPVKKPAPAPAKPAPAPAKPVYKNISLASGATFELGGSTLSAEGKAAVADTLAKFKGEKIESVIIEGHTDSSGAASFNQQLSEKRAEAVKNEMVANGVDASVIKTVGHGESKPVASNDTREGRAKNRRVEIKVDAKTRQQ